MGIAGIGFATAQLTVLLASLRMPRLNAVAPPLAIGWNPWRSGWANIRAARESRTLHLSILGISWFWACGALVLAQLPLYAMPQQHSPRGPAFPCRSGCCSQASSMPVSRSSSTPWSPSACCASPPGCSCAVCLDCASGASSTFRSGGAGAADLQPCQRRGCDRALCSVPPARPLRHGQQHLSHSAAAHGVSRHEGGADCAAQCRAPGSRDGYAGIGA